jgi:endonuclease YncB( thermonuclease family)
MRIVVVAASCAVAALVAVAAAGAGRFDRQGTVTHVVDGDTIDVRLAGGRLERVRVLGIDTPERGTCWAAEATAATSRLAQGKAVALVGDATQDTRDRYGRLLAYVSLPGGRDLGVELVAGGFAKVYVYSRAFERLRRYETAQARGKAKGLWKCGTPSPKPKGKTAGGNCHPSYAGACLDPSASDYDCAGGSGNGPLYVAGPVEVVGPDVFRLDGNGDGVGCE